MIQSLMINDRINCVGSINGINCYTKKISKGCTHRDALFMMAIDDNKETVHKLSKCFRKTKIK